jgi:phosphate/sulfate permease
MNAGERERARVGRMLMLPGWALTLALAAIVCVVAHFAGVPASWTPLVIGGGLGLATALSGRR